MIFVANKYNLDYYSGKPDYLCYCDYLVSASDMYLQGFWNANASPYSASVEVWSVDGNTALEVVDPNYYSIYFFVNPFTNQHGFTFRLKSYTDIMCNNKCFLMRIGISNTNGLVFAAYTERYCIAECCEYASGVRVRPDGSIVWQDVAVTGETAPTGTCGNRLIRVITTSDCQNVWTGEYYGQPARILGGDYFPYVSISAFAGRVEQAARDITREISYNCKPQRIESAKQYRVVANEIFPAWKMDELSSNFSSSKIYIDDFREIRQFEYYGGTPFERYDGEGTTCYNVYRLALVLSGCITRQIFGCVTSCEEVINAALFIIPANYQDGTVFYDNNGNIIATSVETLLQWFISNGMTATQTGLSPQTCPYNTIIQVTGGVIPQSIFYYPMSYTTEINALYVSLEDICDYIPTYCTQPIVAGVTQGDIPCDTPIVLGISQGDITGDALTLTEVSPWVLSGDPMEAGAVAYNNIVTLNLKADRPVTQLNGETYNAVDELVSYITNPPLQNVVLTPDNSNMPAGQYLLIDTLGRVYFSGDILITVDNTAVIDLDNLIYNTL